MNKIDFKKIIPKFLLNDKFINDVSEIINGYLTDKEKMSNYLFFGNNLDNFGDEILDKFAEDRGIFWYDSLLPIDRKREIIKNYRLTYRNLGTELAVKQLISDYFGGEGELENWYDYDGTHHRFKVKIRAKGVPISFVNRFVDALYWVKSADTWLDFITFVQDTTNIDHIIIKITGLQEKIKIGQRIDIIYQTGFVRLGSFYNKEKQNVTIKEEGVTRIGQKD